MKRIIFYGYHLITSSLGFNEMPSLAKQNSKHDDYYKLHIFYYNHQNKIFAIGFTSCIVVFSILL